MHLNDLLCVEWDVKPYTLTHSCTVTFSPDIPVGGLMLYSDSSFFLSSFFFRHVASELVERNSTKIGHIVGSRCNLKHMSKIWGIPSLYKSGTPKQRFSTTSHLNGNLTAYITHARLLQYSSQRLDRKRRHMDILLPVSILNLLSSSSCNSAPM